ncbi:hypothetical protein DYB25_012432, partial [Aphanomyces astaci]
CLAFLKMHAATPRLFRTTVSQVYVAPVKDYIESHGKMPSGVDPHVASAVLLDFLRHIPEPLVTSDKFDAFVASSRMASEADGVRNLTCLVADLPVEYKVTMEVVFGALAEVLAHAEENGLTIVGLSIALAPAIVRKRDMTKMQTQDVRMAAIGAHVVELLLLHHTSIFQQVRDQIANAHKSKSPISLAALHAYVGSRLPPTTLRAKGILYIQEDPTHRYVFQLSGKHRIQVVSTGVWPCAPSTQLAVIGTDFEFDQVQKDLETLSQNDLASDALACADLVRADDRFELVHVTASHIEFRVRCPVTTLDETMLRHHHHIDMDDLNEQLGVAVNLAGGGGGLVLSLPRPDVALLASVAGPHTLRTMWPLIDLHATKILHVVRRKLAECMCGF